MTTSLTILNNSNIGLASTVGRVTVDVIPRMLILKLGEFSTFSSTSIMFCVLHTIPQAPYTLVTGRILCKLWVRFNQNCIHLWAHNTYYFLPNNSLI